MQTHSAMHAWSAKQYKLRFKQRIYVHSPDYPGIDSADESEISSDRTVTGCMAAVSVLDAIDRC